MKSEGVNEDSGIVLGILQAIDSEDKVTQRAVASELGIALGLVNTYLRRFVRKGLVKATNFKNSHNKAAYMYLLTPRGVESKAALTMKYLQIKMREYEALRVEIEEVRREAHRNGEA